MLTVDNLSKSFGKKTVLDNISVQLTHGFMACLAQTVPGKQPLCGALQEFTVIMEESLHLPTWGIFLKIWSISGTHGL